MSAKFTTNLNSHLFPFLTILTFAFLFIESVTYSGFLSKFLLLDAKSFLFIDILSALILLSNKANVTKQKYQFSPLVKLLFQLNYLLGPVLIVLYYIMISVDVANYPNFVFSTFHINPDNFLYLVYLSVSLVVVGLLMIDKKDNLLPLILRRFEIGKKVSSKIFTFFALSILLFGLGNFANTAGIIFKTDLYILSHLGLTYDDKMSVSWNYFYKYMTFVKSVTPEDAIIAIPPSVRPWLSEGNSVLVRYFLYPRKLISSDEEATQKLTPNYYLLAKGLWKVSDESEYGWPREKIKAESIIYFYGDTRSFKEVRANYDPSDIINKNSWGVIKVK